MKKSKKVKAPQPEKGNKGSTDNFYQEIGTTPIEIELGLDLIPLVDIGMGSDLLERITYLRKRFVADYGFIIPAVRILDNLALDPLKYRILIHGSMVGEWEIQPDKLLAIITKPEPFPAFNMELLVEPVKGYQALWINPVDRIELESKGLSVVEPSFVIISHLMEKLRLYAAALIGKDDTQYLLDHLQMTHPVLIGELKDSKIGLGLIQYVLQNLLREGLSIRNLPFILETIHRHSSTSQDTDSISEQVRLTLIGRILQQYVSRRDNILHLLTFAPDLVEKIGDTLVSDPFAGQKVILNKDDQNNLIGSLKQMIPDKPESDCLVLVVPGKIRLPLAKMLFRTISPLSLAVIAEEEIPNSVESIIDKELGQTSLGVFD